MKVCVEEKDHAAAVRSSEGNVDNDDDGESNDSSLLLGGGDHPHGVASSSSSFYAPLLLPLALATFQLAGVWRSARIARIVPFGDSNGQIFDLLEWLVFFPLSLH